jgi:hypothetical protein
MDDECNGDLTTSMIIAGYGMAAHIATVGANGVTAADCARSAGSMAQLGVVLHSASL